MIKIMFITKILFILRKFLDHYIGATVTKGFGFFSTLDTILENVKTVIYALPMGGKRSDNNQSI